MNYNQPVRRRLKLTLVCLLTAVVSFTASACGNKQQAKEGQAGNHQVEITVSAASSLMNVLTDIRERYAVIAPGVKLNLNFGSSGALQQQIRQGAPVQLFISAAAGQMESLAEAGMVDKHVPLLRNELAIITTSDRPIPPVSKMKDLLGPGIYKVAVGIPETVPAGAYAKEALQHAGIWEELQARLVQAKDVRQVLHYVETGNTDAGFVYQTDVSGSENVRIAFLADQGSYSPIIYSVGIITGAGPQPAEVEAFYSYLQSKEAMDIFTSYGFSIPGTR